MIGLAGPILGFPPGMETPSMPATEAAIPAAATRAERTALRVLQLAAVAIVVAASIRKEFELDRFFIPKEIVLHAAAFAAGWLALARSRRLPSTWVDLLLLGALLLSAASAVLAANPWLGARALAITVSSFVLFRTARALNDAGLARPLLAALAFGAVLVAVGSLLQTYGIRTELFSLNRAPGGTLGNRNFVAHAAAFGFPIVLVVALGARRVWGFLAGTLGAAILAGVLVLTRSRAAWLAFATVLVILVLALLISRALRGEARIWLRLGMIFMFAAAAVAAAVSIPNALNWRSNDPYIDTVRRVAEFDEGSGRGRLIQYRQSLAMAVANPVLGVGPGNWGVEYPQFAARRDPSMSSEGGMTWNPWPSSDWVAWTSERGFASTLLLAIVFAAIAVHAFGQLHAAPTAHEGLRATALLGILAATAIAGAFDAVLLLALPSFFVWTAVGAMWRPILPSIGTAHPRAWGTVMLVLVLASGVAAVRSALQLAAIEIHSTRDDRAALELASKLDPGNYRLRLRLARLGGAEKCRHAVAARGLYPQADAASRLARGCD
jgi:O-antigen ligase